MPLTFQQVREAFQNAIPRRRDDLEQRVRDRLQTIAHEESYQARYPVEVLRMAETEVRERSALAAQRVRDLLDSGWRPEIPTAVRSAYGDMYSGFDDWRKDPSSDLYQHVEVAFSSVGLHAPERAIEHARRLGEVQVQAAAEALSDLDVYAAKHVDFTPLKTAAVSLAAAVVGAPETIKTTDITAIPSPWVYDVFISHASSDKKPFVEDLASALTARGLRVWYDTHTLRIGDSIREKIDDGLKSSKHAVVVLSKTFFERFWPTAEMDALFQRQSSERTNVILPIWHGVTHEDVMAFSPVIAARMAMNSNEGVNAIADEIAAVVKNNNDLAHLSAPLIRAVS